MTSSDTTPAAVGAIDVIITGVGGQGNVVASRLLASAAVAAGLRVAVGETFGASQRGGSVMSHVRIRSDRQPGPLIQKNGAAVIIGLEPLETLRVLKQYGHPETTVLASDRPIVPIGCLSGEQSYPPIERIEAALRALCPKTTTLLPAVAKAVELGSAKATNVVMLGALSAAGVLDLEPGRYVDAVRAVFKPKLHELNRKALGAGAALLRGAVDANAASA